MVLSYLRLDSDSTDFIIAPCPLVKTVQESIHKYARIFVMKKIGLNFQEEEFYVLSDGKWLSFVIEQILSNALKYTKEGSVTITIDRKQPALIISDTGIGIRPDDLSRILRKALPDTPAAPARNPQVSACTCAAASLTASPTPSTLPRPRPGHIGAHRTGYLQECKVWQGIVSRNYGLPPQSFAILWMIKYY